MRLLDIEPRFLKIEDLGKTHRYVDDIATADGVMFRCPKCGDHYVICWRPRVPQSELPGPGRWEFEGTGYSDLSLVAGSSSVLLTGGCQAHFFVRNGRIDFA